MKHALGVIKISLKLARFLFFRPDRAIRIKTGTSLGVAACLTTILRLRIRENSKSLPLEGRIRKGLLAEARRGRETFVRPDDIAPRMRVPGTRVIYARTSFYFRLSLILPTWPTWVRRHGSPVPRALACKMTFTTSACPGRCPQEVHAPAREKLTSRRNEVSHSIPPDIGPRHSGRGSVNVM